MVGNICNRLSMMHSTLEVQDYAGSSGKGHLIGAWQISTGYSVAEKTRSASGCERLLHRFQTFSFVPVPTKMQPQSFQTKTGPAVLTNISVLVAHYHNRVVWMEPECWHLR